MKKRIFTGLLVLCTIFNVLPVSVFAAEMIQTMNVDLTGKPKVDVFLDQPRIESKLPIDATFEQLEVADQMINPGPWSGELSFSGDFLNEANEMVESMTVEEHANVMETLNAALRNQNLYEADKLEDITYFICPYLNVEVTDVETFNQSSNGPEVTLNIELLYNAVASTTENADEIQTTGNNLNAIIFNNEPQTMDLQQGTEVEITVPLPGIFNAVHEFVVVRHEKTDENGNTIAVYYYDVNVNPDETITFVAPNGLNTFVITTDNRSVTVEYNKSDSTTEVVSYTVTDINSSAFPITAKDGFVFKGWNFEGVAGGPYLGQMNEHLFNDLYEVYSNNNAQPIIATPILVEEPKPSSGDSDDENIAEEVETEKEIETDSTDDETVRAGKDELKELIGHSYGLYELALSLKLKGELDETTDIRIKVDEASIYDDVIILQKTENSWKTVPAYAEDGYVVGKFTNLSEILIFLNPNGLRDTPRPSFVHPAPQATTPAGTTPAATGDSSNVVGYISAIAVAAVGLTVLTKKTQENGGGPYVYIRNIR